MAKLIKATGEQIEVKPTDKVFSVVELQNYVGGYFEFVSIDDQRVLVVNEDGRELGLLVNYEASRIWGGGELVGDVLLVEKKEME